MDTNKKKLPLGLRLLRVLMIIAGVFILLAIVGSISTVILSKLATERFGGSSIGVPYLDLAYLLFNLIYAAILIVCISRPRRSLYKITTSLIIIDIVASAIFLFIGYQELTANVISVVINLWTLWYLLKLKTYFITGSVNKDDPQIKKIDKKFVIGFVILLILSILVPIAIGFTLGVQKGLKEASNITTFLKEFQNKTGQQAVEYCSSLSSDQKDECIIYLISLSQGDKEGKILKDTNSIDISVCQLFSEESGKTSCYAIMNRCDLVTDDKMHAFCEPAAQKFQAKGSMRY